VPVTKAVVLVKPVPPVNAAYHFIAVPVATKFATVEAVQKVCATAVGAVIGVIVTETAVLVLSQVPTVCDA
jgi:hypothetical protein